MYAFWDRRSVLHKVDLVEEHVTILDYSLLPTSDPRIPPSPNGQTELLIEKFDNIGVFPKCFHCIQRIQWY